MTLTHLHYTFRRRFNKGTTPTAFASERPPPFSWYTDLINLSYAPGIGELTQMQPMVLEYESLHD